MNGELATQGTSLSNFPEEPALDLSLTPRSFLACEMEGIRVEDLVYRAVEDFDDKQSSSPRLSKLRFDFHEAKRQDLVGVAKASYGRLVDEEGNSRNRSLSQVPRSAIAAINMEKEKLMRYQQSEKRWLENCLNQELRYLRQMEADDKEWETGIRRDHGGRMKEEVKRVKELNERRRKIEDQKERVMLAQQELERERAKQVLLQHQEEARLEEERELARKKAAEKRIEQEAEARRLKELERRQKEEESWEAKQRSLQRLHEEEEERWRIIVQNKNLMRRKIHQRLSTQEARVVKSIEKSQYLENQRKNSIVRKLVAEKERDQKLAISKQQQAELAAKRSLQQLLRLKNMHEENQKKMDEKRKNIIHHHKNTDQRVAAHGANQTRYFEYRRELERLRSRNKELNVERQRRKEQYLRDMYAARVVEKDSKVETIQAQRQRLWDQRRQAASQSQQTRDHVKQLILDMRMKSKMDPNKLQEYMDRVLEKTTDEEETPPIVGAVVPPLPPSTLIALISPKSSSPKSARPNRASSPREPATSPVDPIADPIDSESLPELSSKELHVSISAPDLVPASSRAHAKNSSAVPQVIIPEEPTTKTATPRRTPRSAPNPTEYLKESARLFELVEEIRQEATGVVANETSNVDAFLARETAIADQEQEALAQTEPEDDDQQQFTKIQGELELPKPETQEPVPQPENNYQPTADVPVQPVGPATALPPLTPH